MRNRKRQRFGFLETLEERQVLSAATIVFDSNTSEVSSRTNPSVAVGDDLYVMYAQLDELQQRQFETPFELWRFSGGEQAALVDTIPAVGWIDGMAASGNDLYFAVNSSLEPDESDIPHTSTLWRYSVEDAAATRLMDLPTSAEMESTVSVVGATENAVLLAGYSFGGIQELSGFTIDEEPDATDLELVSSIDDRNSFLSFTTFADSLFFEVRNFATFERSLWKTDGTTEGTAEVLRDGQSIESSDVVGTYQDTLVITTMQDDAPVALSLSQDGQFTEIVANGQVVSADGERLYSVDRGENELWMTDALGEESLVWDSEFEFTTALPGGSFIFGTSGQGHESVQTNGSVVVRIDRQFPGTDARPVPEASVIDGQDVKEFLFQHDGGSGPAWWTSDGNSEGTREFFQRYETGTQGSYPVLHGAVGDQLIFTARGNSINNLREIFTTDGIDTQSLNADGTLLRMRVVDDSAFFALQPASRFDVGAEPWYSDGTPEGTRMIGDLNPGRQGSNPGAFTVFGDSVLFTANGSEIWSVDPAGHNPSLLTDAFSEIRAMTVAEDRLFISGSQTQEGIQNGLWVMPETGIDELQLIDTFVSAPERMASSGGRLFFTVGSNNPLQVWTVKDGTAEQLLSDDSVRPFTSSGINVNGVFEANPGIVVNESYVLPLWNTSLDNSRLSIWATDGTDTGSGIVAELEAGFPRLAPQFYVNEVKTHLAVQTDAGIWFTDATEAGTRLFDGEGILAGSVETDFYTIQNVPVPSLVEGVTIDSMSITRIDPTSMDQEVLLEPGSLLDAHITFPNHESIVELNGNIYFEGSDRRYGDEVRRLDLDPLPGDANGDNVVGFDDFLALSASFGKERDAVYAEGDFDGNGRVDFSDFLILSGNFGLAE